jgi:hypothetical protein
MDEGQNHAVLNRCDLSMARDEIADIFKLLKAEADREGGVYIIPQNHADAWMVFRDHPSMDNAVKLLKVIPALLPYFEACCPGTTIYEGNMMKRRHGIT